MHRLNSRSGTALIIALGLVAVLLIICVAFTIDMRVERSGAANVRHASQARQLVKGAVASVIATVDLSVGDEAVPPWFDIGDVSKEYYTSDFIKDETGRNVVFYRDTISSVDGHRTECKNLVSAEAEKYLPAGLAYKCFSSEYYDGRGWHSIHSPEWVPIFSRGNQDLIGRYAYVVFNTTGLLDLSAMRKDIQANDPGKCSPERWMGLDPAEIEIRDFAGDSTGKKSILPDVESAVNLYKNAKNAGRYESYAEMADLDTNKSKNERGLKRDDTTKQGYCRSFNTFSYEPIDTNRIDISTLAQIKNQKGKVIEAFCRSGLTGGKVFASTTEKDEKGNPVSVVTDCEQARWAYLGLVDFTDGDSDMEEDEDGKIPAPYLRPATEPMPLMSGFIGKIKFSRRACLKKVDLGNDHFEWVPDESSFEYKVVPEFRVPFVSPIRPYTAGATFKLEGKVRLYTDDPEWGKVFPDQDEGKDFDVKSIDVKYGDDDEACQLTELLKTNSRGWVKIAGEKIDLNHSDKRGKKFSFFACAAGATMLGDKYLHRYPVNENNYKHKDDSDYWMTVQVRPVDYDVEFPAVPRQELYEDSNKKVDVWETEMVVFAEFADPRFACLEMLDNNGRGRYYTDMQQWFYHPSHLREYNTGDPPTQIPTVKLHEKAGFGNFTGYTQFDSNDDLYKHYFPTSDRVPVYSSPIATYLLGNPDAFLKMYPVNADGIRKEATAADTEPAWLKWRSYVKNDELESVGELGYLPIGLWYTIRLFDYGDRSWNDGSGNNAIYGITPYNKLPFEGDQNRFRPFHRVLDYFTVTPEAIGKLNVNTADTGILATVFNHMPIGTEDQDDAQIPVGPSYKSVIGRVPSPTKNRDGVITSQYDAMALATLVKSVRGMRGGAIADLSDIGYITSYNTSADGNNDKQLYGTHARTAVKIVNEIAKGVRNGVAFGEWEREALIRNSCGLLTTRGQTFVAVVRAESNSPKFSKTSVADGTVNAAKTAVVQFWRDTVPQRILAAEENKDGGLIPVKRYKNFYPVFIQFFKILDE